MQAKIIIKNLLVRGVVGINDWERKQKQDIRINVELSTQAHPGFETDNIDDVINYRTINKSIISFVESSSYLLLEKLAYEISDLLLADKRISHVKIRVEKPLALRFAESVGIELERDQDDR